MTMSAKSAADSCWKDVTGDDAFTEPYSSRTVPRATTVRSAVIETGTSSAVPTIRKLADRSPTVGPETFIIVMVAGMPSKSSGHVCPTQVSSAATMPSK